MQRRLKTQNTKKKNRWELASWWQQRSDRSEKMANLDDQLCARLSRKRTSWNAQQWQSLSEVTCVLQGDSEASLVAQGRIRSPLRETRVQSLIWEGPTCCGSAKPMHRSCWACVLELRGHNYWSRCAVEPVLRNEKSHRSEKPAYCNKERPPLWPENSPLTAAKAQHSQERIKLFLKRFSARERKETRNAEKLGSHWEYLNYHWLYIKQS